MSIFKKVNVGFVLTPGCRMADIIETDIIFRFNPKTRSHYIAEAKGPVIGRSDFTVVANATYDDCPELDVLVVGEMSERESVNKDLLKFVAAKAAKAKYVIGISNGVWTLFQAGLIKDEKITADRNTLDRLRKEILNVVDKRKSIKDGKLLTSGPSTGAIESAFAVYYELSGKWKTKFAELTLEYDALVQYPLLSNIVLQVPKDPKPLKVGVFAAPNIFIPDVMGAVDVFGALPNCEFHYVSHTKGTSKSMIGFGPDIESTVTFDNCPQLDVLIVGATHPKYLKDPEVLDFILHQEKNASAIICVCAGTFLVGATGLLEGKNAATNYQQAQSLPKIGVTPTDQEIAVDGKFFSAGPAVGSYTVGLKAVEKIVGREWAQYIEHEVLEFAPNPLFGAGSAKTADKSAVLLAKAMSTLLLNPLFNSFLKKGYYAQGIKPK
ncbi:hypothetical protein EYV94_23260 [Puteibacter caeruleilacunae]|nr:hypothetical protein EYV94_23260 [Puteibacter caeruleilacunae]